jgi:aerobic carbon-monoxide dehydrogenase large subunit
LIQHPRAIVHHPPNTNPQGRTIATTGIGASVARREDLRLLTGAGRYTDDIRIDKQAHAVFVRSPHAHADVIGVDINPALTVPGVLGVFTGRDLVDDGVGPIPALIAERSSGTRCIDRRGMRSPAIACVMSVNR